MLLLILMEDIYDKFNIDILYEEEVINKLLKNIKFNIPELNFQKYKKQTNNNNHIDSLYNLIKDNKLDNQLLNNTKINKNIYSNKKYDEEFQNKNLIKNYIKKDIELLNNNNNEFKNHTIDYEKEINNFKRNCLIIKTFIFKGYSFGQYNKPSILELYINIEIIKNLKPNKNEKIIKKEAFEKYLKEKKNLIKIFDKIKILHDSFYEKLIKLKSNNKIKLFILQKLQKYQKNKKAIPSKKDMLNECNDYLLKENNTIVNENKTEYEDNYYLLDVYEYIHLIKPYKPNNYYLIFFYKNYNNIKFKDIHEFINIYNKQSKVEREKIELINYRLLLSFKYKSFIFNKKRSIIFPNKQHGVFSYFIKSNNLKINYNNENNIKYLSIKYNNLNKKNKKMLISEYNGKKEKYNQLIKKLNNYIFELPTKSANIFNFFIQDKIKEITIDFKFNKELLIKFIRNWKSINKNMYKDKYIIDNLKYEVQIQQFELFNFYNKKIDTSNVDKLKKYIINEIIDFYYNRNHKNNKIYNEYYYDEYINYILKKLEYLD